MKGLIRVALMVGLVATSAAPVDGAMLDRSHDEGTTEIYVVNNHLVAVRVFAEDANGRLHRLGRVARGTLGTFSVPEDVSAGEFRIKVFPTSAAWSTVPDNFGVKTSLLDANRDRQVRVWLETDLAASMVEIDRG